MSKKSSSSEVSGFITINSDRSSKSSRTIKNASERSNQSQSSLESTSRSVTKTSAESKNSEGENKKSSDSSVIRSKVIDVKITKKSAAASVPRASLGATKAAPSRPARVTRRTVSNAESQDSAKLRTSTSLAKGVLRRTISTTKSRAVTLESQSTLLKATPTKLAPSQQAKTSNVRGLPTKGPASKTPTNTMTRESKPGSIKKTPVGSTLKSKVTNQSSVSQRHAVTLSSVAKTNSEETKDSSKISKNDLSPTSVLKDVISAKRAEQKNLKSKEEDDIKIFVQEAKSQPAGPKREGTWIKEESSLEVLQESRDKTENVDDKSYDKTNPREHTADETEQPERCDPNMKPTNLELQVQQQSLASLQQPDLLDEDPYYEDDFEDYQSDFEEYVSDESGVSSSGGSASGSSVSFVTSEITDTSEESEPSKNRPEDRKLDSGNYDMRRGKTGFFHPRPSSYQVEEKNENAKKTTTKSLKDERSFYSDLFEWRPSIKQRKMSKVKERGEKLLRMIKLDITSMTLLTMAPIPYDIFIKVYGKKNTQQRSVQTNEDCSHQEVQTDEIKHKDKWTQFPVKYHNWGESVEDSLTQFYKDKRGVGDDNSVNTEFNINFYYDLTRLNHFLDYAAEVMVVSLEESGLVERGRANAVKSDLPFSQGCLVIKPSGQGPLAGRRASLLSFSPHNPNYVLVVYQPKDEQTEEDELSSRCIVCLWNVLAGDAPPKSSLLAPSTVTSVAFDSHHTNIIYAGLLDGGVSVWELKDKGTRLSISCKMNELRPPSYSTCGVMGDEGHLSAVISVQSFTLVGTKPSDKFVPSQLATLEELGRVILWSVVARRPWEVPQDFPDITSDLGAAPWATLALTHSLTIMPFEQLSRSMWEEVDSLVMSTCMVRLADTSSVLVGSDMGQVALCSLLTFDPSKSYFKHSQSFEKPSVTCIEVCPTNSQLFMVGMSSGVVRLHVVGRSKPLRIFSCLHGSVMPSVIALSLSSQRPGLVFASHSNSMMYVWNICESDIAPLFPVKFNDIDLSTTTLTTNGKSSYLAVVADNDSVQIHKIKKEFTMMSPIEGKIFATYVTLV